MELAITAPHAGVLAGLAVAPGDHVAPRQPLVADLAPPTGDDERPAP